MHFFVYVSWESHVSLWRSYTVRNKYSISQFIFVYFEHSQIKQIRTQTLFTKKEELILEWKFWHFVISIGYHRLRYKSTYFDFFSLAQREKLFCRRHDLSATVRTQHESKRAHCRKHWGHFATCLHYRAHTQSSSKSKPSVSSLLVRSSHLFDYACFKTCVKTGYSVWIIFVSHCLDQLW